MAELETQIMIARNLQDYRQCQDRRLIILEQAAEVGR